MLGSFGMKDSHQSILTTTRFRFASLMNEWVENSCSFIYSNGCFHSSLSIVCGFHIYFENHSSIEKILVVDLCEDECHNHMLSLAGCRRDGYVWLSCFHWCWIVRPQFFGSVEIEWCICWGFQLQHNSTARLSVTVSLKMKRVTTAKRCEDMSLGDVGNWVTTDLQWKISKIPLKQ